MNKTETITQQTGEAAEVATIEEIREFLEALAYLCAKCDFLRGHRQRSSLFSRRQERQDEDSNDSEMEAKADGSDYWPSSIRPRPRRT